jgi:hypothetical protein
LWCQTSQLAEKLMVAPEWNSSSVDLDHLALPRTRSDRAFRLGGRGQRGDALDRSQQVDQRGDVIGAHVHDRAGAGLVEEVRRGMPAFGPMALDGGVAGGDGADGALVQDGAGLLVRAAEEGVRRAADRQALGLCQIAQGDSLFQGQHEGLF